MQPLWNEQQNVQTRSDLTNLSKQTLYSERTGVGKKSR